MSTPFVGRLDELRRLRDLVSVARHELVPVAGLIVGEPGSGKSRLLREVLAGADPRRTVLMAGFEPTEPIALAAAGDLIRRLATVAEHGPRLDALAFGSTMLTGQGLLSVFEAAHRAHAAFGLLVLAVDDLQWVDAQSLALLHYLVSAAESSRLPLALFVASRPSAAASSFDGGIGGPLPEGRRVSIGLRGLPLADGAALARAIDTDLGPRQAEELWRRAAGSPFWLEALARAHMSADAGELLADRLRNLSADAATVLNILVVGARPYAREELEATVAWPRQRLGQAVRELAGRGLAVEDPGFTRLAHDLIREAAARGVPAATARAIHARLAEALASLAGDDIQLLAEVLDHRVRARLPTADLAARLVASPHRRLLGDEQVRRLSSITDALSAGPQRLELDRGLGRLAAAIGDQELALRHWSRAAADATDPEQRLRAHVEAARAAWEAGSSTDAHAQIDSARSLPIDPFTAIELDALDADVALDLDKAVARGAGLAQRALALAHESTEAAGGAERLPVHARAPLLAATLAAAKAAWKEERADDLYVVDHVRARHGRNTRRRSAGQCLVVRGVGAHAARPIRGRRAIRASGLGVVGAIAAPEPTFGVGTPARPAAVRARSACGGACHHPRDGRAAGSNPSVAAGRAEQGTAGGG